MKGWRGFKKVVTLLLVFVMLSSTGTPAFAKYTELSGGAGEEQTADENSAMMELLRDEYGDEQASEMHEVLQKIGLINQDGEIAQMPIQLDGEEYTLDEMKDLLDQPKTDLNQIATVDGQEISLESLKKIIEIETEISELSGLQDTSDVHITKDHLNNLESLIDQAGTEGLSTIPDGEMQASDTGAEMDGDYEDATIVTVTKYHENNEVNKHNEITLTFELNREQNKPVSFAYETMDGALGSPSVIGKDSGVVTFEPGDTEKTLEINADFEDYGGEDFEVEPKEIFLNPPSSLTKELLEDKVWQGLSRADYFHFYDYDNLDDINFDVEITASNKWYKHFIVDKVFHHNYNGGAYLSYSMYGGSGLENDGGNLFSLSIQKFDMDPLDSLEIKDVEAKAGDYTTGQIVPITVTYNTWVTHKRHDPVLHLANDAKATPEIFGGVYLQRPKKPPVSLVNGYQVVVEKGMKPEGIQVEKSKGEGVPAYPGWRWDPDEFEQPPHSHNDATWDKPFSNKPEITFSPARADAFESLELDASNYKIGDTINFTIELDHAELDEDKNTASDWIIDGGTDKEQLKNKLRLSIGDKEHGLVDDLDWKETEDPDAEGTILEGTMEVTEETLDLVTDDHEEDGALRAKIYYNKDEGFKKDTDNFILLQDHFAPFQIEKAKYIGKDDLTIDYPDEWPSGEKNLVSLVVPEPTRLDFTYPEDATYTDDDQFKWKTSNDSVASIRRDGTIIPKRSGTVTFELIAKNGSSEHEISVKTEPIEISANGPAALNIPSYSDQIRVEKNHDAHVLWSTNVMDKYEEQAAEGQDPEDAHFTVELYKGNHKLDDLTDKTPFESWKAPETKELINATFFKIPGKHLSKVSEGSTPSYTVKLSTKNPNPNRKDFSAVAYILVTSPEAVVNLDDTKQFITDNQGTLPLNWTLDNFDLTNKGDFEFKVTKNGDLVPGSKITFDANTETFDAANVDEKGGSYDLSIDPVKGKDRSKDVYAITLKAKNGLDSTWSYDSLYLQVYKQGAFRIQVDGEDETSYTMTNIPEIESMTENEILNLDRNITLSHQVGINNDAYTDLGAITDQFAWESSQDDVAGLFYRSGAVTDNIRHLNIDSYQPKQLFTLGGMSDGTTTITAEHVNTGMKSKLDLQVKTLKDKLYLFNFFPKTEAAVTYTDKKGEEKEVTTNGDGELALYDEEGIGSDVYVTSTYDGETYTGVINQSNVKSQEGNPITGDLYPVNTLQMRELAKVDVYFKKPDGSPYTGKVTYFGGVYKNGHFAEATEIGEDGKMETLGKDGKLEVSFDTTDFYSEEAGEKVGAELSAKDKLAFMIEAHFEGDHYYPQVYTIDGDTSPVDMIAIGDKITHLTDNNSGDTSVFAVNQYVQKNKDANDRDYITDYNGRFGPSDQNPSIKLVTEFMWWGEDVDEGGSATLRNDAGATPPAQSDETFQYPFSKWHTTRHVQVLNKDTIWLDKGKAGSIHFKLYDGPDHFLKDVNTPATLVNLIGVNNATPEELKEKLGDMKQEMANVSGEIDAPDKSDDLTRQALGLLKNLNVHVGGLDMQIIPTIDPTLYKTFIKLDAGGISKTGSDGLHVDYGETDKNYTPGLGDTIDFLNSTYMENQKKELENRMKGLGSLDKDMSLGGYFVGEIKYNPNTGKWENLVQSGGFHAGGEVSYTKHLNEMVGPVPVTFSLGFGGGAEVDFAANVQYKELPGLDWSDPEQEGVNDYLTSLRINAYIEAFGGIGFDYSVIAAKIGFFGKIMVEDTNTWLNRDYLDTGSERVKYGNKLTLEGIVGVRATLKFLFVSFSYDFASLRYSRSWMFNHWAEIEDYWEDRSQGPLTAENMNEATFAYMESIGEDPIRVINSQTLENRDYLKEYNRVWNTSGQSVDGMNNRSFTLGLESGAGEPQELQSNAYPHSDPEVADDGSLVVYLSDGDSSNIEDTVASWMVRDGNGYKDKGAIAGGLSERGYGDTNLHVAGEGDFIAATWVRQMEKIDKEAGEDLTNEDIMLMNNSAEVMVSIYDGTKWTTTQLTDNKSPDLAPVVSVNNGKVLVAYRSVSAANIDNPLDFSESDHIVYQVYDNKNKAWSETETLYNGTQGHVMGLSTEMLSNGRTAIVYTLNQEEKDNGNSEGASNNQIVYGVVDTDADTSASSEGWQTNGVIKNLQVTEDESANENPQLTSAKFQDGKERFILGWYLSTKKGDLTDADIRLVAFDGKGEVDPSFVDSLSDIKGANRVTIDPNFTFARNAKAFNTLDDLSIIWKDAEAEEDSDKILSRDRIKAVKFGEDSDGGLFLSGVLPLGTLPDETQAEAISAYVKSDSEVKSLILGTTYTEDTETIGEVTPQSSSDGESIPVDVAKTVSAMYMMDSKFENKFKVNGIHYNPEEIVPGFDLPVQFNVVNQGMGKITKVDVSLDGAKTSYDDELKHVPNETKTYTATYSVPESIKDIPYDVTVYFEDGSDLSTSGTIKLDIPDVGVSEIQVLKEEGGHRQLSIPIYNKSSAGLDGKGRTVKFGLYKDSVYDKDHLIGNIHDISDDDSLQLMNQGGYTYTYDFDVKSYLKTLKKDEIPSNGLNAFVHAWIVDEQGKEIKEFNSSNNSVKVSIENLATKYKSDPVLLTTNLNNMQAGSEAKITMQNMNMVNVDFGNVLVNLLDEDGKIIESEYIATDADGLLSFTPEEVKHAKISFTKKGQSIQALFFRENPDDLDTSLSNVELEGIPLDFDTKKREYSLNVSDLKETNITAMATNRDATVTLTDEDGNVLSTGTRHISFRQVLESSKTGAQNRFKIEVDPVGEAGNTETYTFNVTNTKTDRPELAIQVNGDRLDDGTYKGEVEIGLPEYQVTGYETEQAKIKVDDGDWETFSYDGTKKTRLITLSKAGEYSVTVKIKLKLGGENELEQDLKITDYGWKKNDDETATITDYVGTDKAVEIPDTLGELTVTGIGDEAFKGNQLTKVSIPDSVTSIGNRAFQSNSLKGIKIPESVTNIGKGAFSRNRFTSITIPDNVEKVGNAAFSNNQLASVEIRNNDTEIGKSVFANNQDEATNLMIVGFDPSTAKDYAGKHGHTFINGEGDVTFSQGPYLDWAQSHSLIVEASGYDDAKPLEYAWATSAKTPENDWSDLSNGSAYATPKETGEYYLHVRGTGLFGNAFNDHSNALKVDNTKPSLTVTPSTTELTHDDVELTVEGSDQHSGVERIQDPDGSWHNMEQIKYNATQNGTYSFIVEDKAGNQSTKEVTVNNIDKTITFEMPTITNMGDITLSDEITKHTTNISPITVKDWRDGDNNWRLEVSANRVKMANGDYELPPGTLRLKPLSEISQVEGSRDLPVKSTTATTEIDNGKVTLATGNNSRGIFDFAFPDSALEFLIDPRTAIVDDPDGTTYETTITWDLITAP